jgi:hypothetical protein
MKQYYTRAEALQAIKQAGYDHATMGSLKKAEKKRNIKTRLLKISEGPGAPQTIIGHEDMPELMLHFASTQQATKDEAKYVFDRLVELMESQAAVALYIGKSEASVSRQRRGRDTMLKSDYKKLMDIYKQLKGGE